LAFANIHLDFEKSYAGTKPIQDIDMPDTDGVNSYRKGIGTNLRR